MKTYLGRLSDRGILSLTRWLRLRPVPARNALDPPDRMEETDVVKLLAATAQAMRELGLDPRVRVVVIRSWATATVLARRAPFTSDELARVRKFADDRSFDLVYLPGIRPEEANRYTVLKEPVYYEAAREIIAGDAERFIRGYPFAVEPATDDRPYFFNFFRWSLLAPLLRSAGTDWVPFVDWGYLALVATLVQAIVLSVLLIVVPLFFLRGKSPARVATGRRPSAAVVLVYFLCLGGSFMFLEISTIQRMIRFLWHPVYSVAVVVTGFLVFAGVGSAAAERIRLPRARKVALAVGGICLVVIAHQFLLPAMMTATAGASFAARAVTALALIAPLAFFMGMPFPTGLAALSQRRAELMPWAWGVNGCASVAATILATASAVSWGFVPVTWMALGGYVLAALLSLRLSADERRAEPQRSATPTADATERM
jgi:hypothetical protein